MEADLQRFYGIDYRDRWRPGSGLTLRRIGALLRSLPPESALHRIARNEEPHWSVEAHLLDDLRMWLTTSKKSPAKPHPRRPSGGPRPADPERLRLLAAGRARARRRREQIAAGEIA